MKQGSVSFVFYSQGDMFEYRSGIPTFVQECHLLAFIRERSIGEKKKDTA